MSSVYRSALTVARKQLYIDWARGLGPDDPALSNELARDRKTIYLVPEFAREPELSRVLDACWEHIFEQELAMWAADEQAWPQPRTREMFDQWFDAEVTLSVYDLASEDPLTQEDIEIADLQDAMTHCASCGADLEMGDGRVISFTLPDRQQLAHRQGLMVPVGNQDDQVLIGVMTLDASEEAARGEDLVFLACTSRCEKVIRKVVPKALKKMR